MIAKNTIKQDSGGDDEGKLKEMSDLNEKLREEARGMEAKLSHLQTEIKLKGEKFLEKEAEIKTLNVEIRNLKLKETQNISTQEGMVAIEEQIKKLELGLRAKEDEVGSLLKV